MFKSIGLSNIWSLTSKGDSPPQSIKQILPGKYVCILYDKYLIEKTIDGVWIMDLDISEVHHKIAEVCQYDPQIMPQRDGSSSPDESNSVCNMQHSRGSSPSIQYRWLGISTWPFLLLGDFSGQYHLWGDTLCSLRGSALEFLFSRVDAVFLKSDTSTHFLIQTGTYSNIDLSIG